eukprot:scaffold66568_cov52-Prasinocladus_malaysianus.AAC.1
MHCVKAETLWQDLSQALSYPVRNYMMKDSHGSLYGVMPYTDFANCCKRGKAMCLSHVFHSRRVRLTCDELKW